MITFRATQTACPTKFFITEAAVFTNHLAHAFRLQLSPKISKTCQQFVEIKVDLKVTEAPPSIRGNTAQGGTKIVTLETGATVDAPLFVNEGDVVRVNTTTGEYVERA